MARFLRDRYARSQPDVIVPIGPDASTAAGPRFPRRYRSACTEWRRKRCETWSSIHMPTPFIFRLAVKTVML